MMHTALSHYQTRVNAALERIFDDLPVTDPRLLDAMRYGTLLGGKRVRPFLVYATGTMLGAKEDDLDSLAAAVECIHAYSLIHDDLPAMDDDHLRRGQPTVHIAFDEATAILAGDALQGLAYELLAEAPLPAELDGNRIAMLRSLARASGYQGMCGGQAIDLASTGKRIELDALQQLHRLKTGALIRSAVEMGSYGVADLPTEHRDALLRYAEAIGLAFQVQDDILDITADTEQLGKPQGSDQAADKSTFPALLGLDGARDAAQSLYQDALTALAELPYNTEHLQAFARYIVERGQ
ncbi:(2E,6E)-farnesyl diphosphate synthase [Ferrimonas balearica]|uniref:(2E,6E)-farnesyl diphosphate synthase n=1 Tax=Ferrimonas balearica TaxID=44012 RepID=UPI001C567181|nr:(2E,6E)-farnesyl diphosphate synthase [Ferrimonas balearica]MBW3137979.1 (2E,6E)-farnesyl diphosphate synthase [Ferrimonas balearica]MBW3164455.1 (2E,6E)-farnesyl diphosphate synthase [Ferrimonas balearica]MBY6105056.1 (2E,6E)-farnesyl diphosphate synthase [Ferrimonas balearica]